MISADTSDESLIATALRSASHTRLLVTRAGVRHETATAFQQQFAGHQAIVITDHNTFAAAGRDVVASLARTGVPLADPFIFDADVYADDRCVKALREALQSVNAIPVAVGSGTINDLTKLAAHQAGRQYLVVATAASMDGYTAYGASITAKGSKQTFDCPAPQAVLADLEVIAAAPRGLNASGYADLLAKVAAGADWIVADALGIEPIDPSVWQTVQGRLKDWVGAPAAVARGEPEALRNLVNGLMMSGFAMQAARSSRPASGADHQFSHLWDMQHHTHEGAAPSHGFKVGIGTLASVVLYEELLQRDFATLDVEKAASPWPTLGALLSEVTALFGAGELADKAKEETAAKYLPREAIREQLLRLKKVWPQLRSRLVAHLIPLHDLRSMLADAGCPTESEQIGISRNRLRHSYKQALFIRRRFTVLDLAHRAGILEECLDTLFGPMGVWQSPETAARGHIA
jgi:glycerol-1-phosphate dehydrogenase [NAD(P)+]